MKKLIISLFFCIISFANIKSYTHDIWNNTDFKIKVTADLVAAPDKSVTLDPNSQGKINVVGWCTRGFYIEGLSGKAKGLKFEQPLKASGGGVSSGMTCSSISMKVDWVTGGFSVSFPNEN